MLTPLRKPVVSAAGAEIGVGAGPGEQPADDCFADVVEGLFHSFEDRHPLYVIANVARQCRDDLVGSGTPMQALPELIDRLARYRLSNHRSERGDRSRGDRLRGTGRPDARAPGHHAPR